MDFPLVFMFSCEVQGLGFRVHRSKGGFAQACWAQEAGDNSSSNRTWHNTNVEVFASAGSKPMECFCSWCSELDFAKLGSLATIVLCNWWHVVSIKRSFFLFPRANPFLNFCPKNNYDLYKFCFVFLLGSISFVYMYVWVLSDDRAGAQVGTNSWWAVKGWKSCRTSPGRTENCRSVIPHQNIEICKTLLFLFDAGLLLSVLGILVFFLQ